MRAHTAFCLVLALALTSFGQGEHVSAYDSLKSLLKDKNEEAIYSHIGGLSKDEFRQMLKDFVQENAGVTQGVFEFMSVLSVPYYARGAGKNDGVSEWAQDVRNPSLPAEWRQVILGHPPFKTHALAPADVAVFTNALTDIAFSNTEPPGLRREALLGLQHAMGLRAYVNMLKESVTSEDEDPRFRREALLQMGRIVYRGQLESQQNPEFNGVVTDYEFLLSDLGGRTNLPSVLDEGVKSLKLQKKPSAGKRNSTLPH